MFDEFFMKNLVRGPPTFVLAARYLNKQNGEQHTSCERRCAHSLAPPAQNSDGNKACSCRQPPDKGSKCEHARGYAVNGQLCGLTRVRCGSNGIRVHQAGWST
jgi:hypothetical protein